MIAHEGLLFRIGGRPAQGPARRFYLRTRAYLRSRSAAGARNGQTKSCPPGNTASGSMSAMAPSRLDRCFASSPFDDFALAEEIGYANYIVLSIIVDCYQLF
jgi:hypothetical protein